MIILIFPLSLLFHFSAILGLGLAATVFFNTLWTIIYGIIVFFTKAVDVPEMNHH